MSDQTLAAEVASVPGISQTVADRVVETFPTREALASASAESLTAVKGVGDVTAERLLGAFAAPPSADADVHELRPDEPAGRAGDRIEGTAGEAGNAADTTQDVAEDALARLRSAYAAAGAGVSAAAGTVTERWPEVRSAFVDAFAETRELGRTVVDSVRTVVREPRRQAS